MTGHEQLMYQVIGAISVSNALIVFKGALIIKLILEEHGFDMLERISGKPALDDVYAYLT